jgi:hypothetical protein
MIGKQIKAPGLSFAVIPLQAQAPKMPEVFPVEGNCAEACRTVG